MKGKVRLSYYCSPQSSYKTGTATTDGPFPFGFVRKTREKPNIKLRKTSNKSRSKGTRHFLIYNVVEL